MKKGDATIAYSYMPDVAVMATGVQFVPRLQKRHPDRLNIAHTQKEHRFSMSFIQEFSNLLS